MSGMVIPDASLPTLDGYAMNAFSGNGLNYHLFISNVTIDQSTVLGDFSGNEASFPGYSAQTPTGWADQGVTAHVDTWTANPLTFTPSGTVSPPQTVYGYYVIDSFGRLLYAESFNTPITLTGPSQSVSFTPQLQFQSMNA